MHLKKYFLYVSALCESENIAIAQYTPAHTPTHTQHTDTYTKDWSQQQWVYNNNHVPQKSVEYDEKKLQ